MILNLEANLRLHLEFLDELDLVRVIAGTNDWDQRLAFMGVVKGKEQLVDLLDAAGIDHYTVGGDAGTIPPSLSAAYEIAPQKMVETPVEAIRTEEEMQLRILRGEQPTDEELSIRMPISLRVFSSTTAVREGLDRVQNWFKKQAGN